MTQSAITMNACKLISEETIVIMSLNKALTFLSFYFVGVQTFCLNEWNTFIKQYHVDPQYITQTYIKSGCEFFYQCILSELLHKSLSQV